jgi:hypothetical protein
LAELLATKIECRTGMTTYRARTFRGLDLDVLRSEILVASFIGVSKRCQVTKLCRLPVDPREYGILCEAISVLAAASSTDMWRAELADMTMIISRGLCYPRSFGV